MPVSTGEGSVWDQRSGMNRVRTRSCQAARASVVVKVHGGWTQASRAQTGPATTTTYAGQNLVASYRTINVLEKQTLSRLVLWKHLILASATWTNRPSLNFPIKLKISF